jgi:hypothetical protein
MKAILLVNGRSDFQQIRDSIAQAADLSIFRGVDRLETRGRPRIDRDGCCISRNIMMSIIGMISMRGSRASK